MAKRPRYPVPLTKRRKTEAKDKGGLTFYGKPLTDPAGVEARYRVTLDRLIALMVRDSEKMVRTVWDDHGPAVESGMDASLASQARILGNAMARKFEVLFARLAPGITEQFLRGVNSHSKANLHASLKEVSGGLSLKTSVIDGRIKEILKASTIENIGLIKSIPTQYFQKLQGDVMRSITSGDGVKTVLEAVRKTGQVTENRARLIARDQTSKATTALNSARMQNLGVKEFEWLHSAGGKEPRPLHINTLNGRVFRFDAPPVIDDRTGVRGLPGQLINCRCSIIPVVRFGEDG